PDWGMIARFGALPPVTRTGSWDSKSFEPSYEMVIPVQDWNWAHDFCSESDSGEMIEANIVTFLPACPAYAWYCAQSPVNVGTGAALFEPPPQAPTAITPAPTGANTARPRRR